MDEFFYFCESDKQFSTYIDEETADLLTNFNQHAQYESSYNLFVVFNKNYLNSLSPKERKLETNRIRNSFNYRKKKYAEYSQKLSQLNLNSVHIQDVSDYRNSSSLNSDEVNQMLSNVYSGIHHRRNEDPYVEDVESHITPSSRNRVFTVHGDFQNPSSIIDVSHADVMRDYQSQ